MAACSFVIGIYDGFYGPGTGTFLLLAFTKLGKLDMEKATGNVKVVNLTSNISALITFILARKDSLGAGTFGVGIQHCRTLSWRTYGCEERCEDH